MPDRARHPGFVGAALAGLVVVAVGAFLTLTWAREARTFTASVPQPPPLTATSILDVRPGEDACLSDITILPDSEVALVKVGTRGKPGVPLSATVTGPGGYRATGEVAGREWTDNDLIPIRFRPPDRELHGDFCLRNDGKRRIYVYAAEDRSRTTAKSRIGGDLVLPNMQLTFTEASPGTIAGHRSRITDQLTVFRPAIVGPWTIRLLFALVVAALTVGIPLALLLALRRRPAPDLSSASGAPSGGRSPRDRRPPA